MRYITADDETGGTGGGAGGVAPPVGTPPTTGTTNLSTTLWYDVRWTYTEPAPTGSLTGFELAIFSGTDPDNGALACDIIPVTDPTLRRWVERLTLRAKVDLKVAVRAVYGTLGKSSWSPASAAVTFTPTNVVNGATGAPSYRKLPDGTIMQFAVLGPHTTEENFDVIWALPFPNVCCTCVVSTENVNDTSYADAFYQVVSYNRTGARVFRQKTTTSNDPTRAHILAIGY